MDIDHLHAEVARSQTLAKEEEEKRVKAISLLKTVRQKLVKAEKEKETAVNELTALKEKVAGAEEKEKTELSKLQQEIDIVNAEREKAVVGLRIQFERELANVKEQSNREVSAMKKQFELEAITSKVRFGTVYRILNGNVLCLMFTTCPGCSFQRNCRQELSYFSSGDLYRLPHRRQELPLR
jgi:hypothetical protein